MIIEYKKNPQYFNFKNRVVIGDLNDTWYIIDGQHRIDMCKELFNQGYNNYIIFCWYIFTNEKDMRELFISINKDSTKNKFYVESNTFDQIKISEFTKLLQLYYKNYFSKKKTEQGKRKTCEELRDQLISIDFFNNNYTALELLNNLYNKNIQFYELNRYKTNILYNEDIFYKDELDCINDRVIMSLKKNNFIEWLKDEKNLPFHHYKKQKSKISKSLKNACWIKEYKNNLTGICPISFCKNTISKDKFQAGHIISEYNCGKTNIDNLKPICSSCNLSMGSNNWIDYDKKSLDLN